MEDQTKKIQDLERKVQMLIDQVTQMKPQIELLKRNYQRSKSDISQIAAAINKSNRST
jgi:prefoldin subunit 5